MKFKKILDNECDRLLRDKKETILSDEFLDSAKAHLPLQPRRRAVVPRRAFATVAVVVVLLCTTLLVSLSLHEQPSTSISQPPAGTEVLEHSVASGWEANPDQPSGMDPTDNDISLSDKSPDDDVSLSEEDPGNNADTPLPPDPSPTIYTTAGGTEEFAADMHRPEGYHQNIGSALALMLHYTLEADAQFHVLIYSNENKNTEDVLSLIDLPNDMLQEVAVEDDIFESQKKYHLRLQKEQIHVLAEHGINCMYIGSGIGEYKEINWNTIEGIKTFCEIWGDRYTFRRNTVCADPDIGVSEEPPADPIYPYASYADLYSALTRSDTEEYKHLREEEANSGKFYAKMLQQFGSGEETLYVPAINGKPVSLREAEGYPGVSLLTNERYSLPWIWYHCEPNGMPFIVSIAYTDLLENEAVDSAQTYYEVLKLIAPSAPSPENFRQFESYRAIYEKDISLANGQTVTAMISELHGGEAGYVMLYWNGILVSVYGDISHFFDAFEGAFGLVAYEEA